MFHGDVGLPKNKPSPRNMAKSPIFEHFYGGFMGIPFRSPAAKEVPDPAQAQQATSLSDFGHAWDHHRRSAV